MCVNFPFNIPKGSEAAARFAARAGGRINVLKLSKLVYLLDRMAIESRGIPVMGGHYFSMKDGPMISEVLDLINSKLFSDKPTIWERIFARRKGHEVSMTSRPEARVLSEEEVAMINRLWLDHGKKDQWQLRDWCHANCPEYKELTDGRMPISIADMGAAMKRDEGAIKWMEDEAKAEAQLQAIFG